VNSTEKNRNPTGSDGVPERRGGVLGRLWDVLTRPVGSLEPTAGRTPRAVTVWERTANGWRLLEGKVGGSRPVFVRGRSLPDALPGRAELKRRGFLRGRDAVLVIAGERAVTRCLVLPTTSREEIEQILRVRLEMELPYEPQTATWAWEERNGAAPGGTKVFLMAAPTEDIAGAEAVVECHGQRVLEVQTPQTALGQAAVELVGEHGTAAAAAVGNAPTVLALVAGGRLRRSRCMTAAGGADESPGPVAAELEQTLRHWCMQDGAENPEKLLLAGEPQLAAAVEQVLTEGVAASAETLAASDLKGLSQADLDDEPAAYAACAGALLALHSRANGGPAAAPPLRRRQVRTGSGRRRRLLALALLDVVLLIGLVAAAFAVRSARLKTVKIQLAKAQAALEDFDVLEEEVQILEAEAEVHRSTLDVLRAVVEALPGGVTITNLEVDPDNRITLQGTTPSVEVLSKAASDLEATGMFDELALERVSSGQKGMEFKIRCVVLGGEVSGP